MNLVNAYYILEGDHGFNSFPWSGDEKSQFDVTHKLDINKDRYGEFCWGKKNLFLYNYNFLIYIYDARRIICFTSSVINALKFGEFIKDQKHVKMNIANINVKELYGFNNENIQYFEIDPIIGVSFTTTDKSQSWPTLVKIYKTGLTTFNMTSNIEIIENIMNLNIQLLEMSEKNN
ncbi:hypothetical protein [Bacillus sp. ISL-78]|uniref:hypothetical protein n=2 Tax=unclassified Bacillus (in: firmicutes) TaxID=185979 RepID=UPI001BE9E473|nr:hypothetical protein [Bacillus sp. ISL-78]MBT2618645.1 hypothetical protein [Bacillus sp. ISL-78]